MTPGAQALVDRIVFAIHGEQIHLSLAGGSHYDFTGSDKDFFVGKGHLFAGLHGSVSRFETDNANRC